jgi:outer membrane protein assembly factor BamB
MNYRNCPSILLILIFSHASTLLVGDYGDLKWSAMADDVVYGAPALDLSGNVYISSEDGRVHAFDSSGNPKWIFSGSSDWLDSAPTIAPDGTVYVGSWDGNIYAIDGITGTEKWAYSTGGVIIGSPAIGNDGTVYIGSNDSFFYAIRSDGSLKWLSEAVPSYSAINSSPILSANGEAVYFGNDDGEFYALSSADGALLWSFSVAETHPPDSTTSVAISAAAAIGADGSIYFGCENNYLYALNSDGSLLWSYAAAEPIRSSPAISNDGTLFFAAQDGYLYALDSLGFQLNETYIGDVFYCSPAIDNDGNVLIAGYAGSSTIGAATRFVSVNPDGQIIWEYIIEDYNDASPNIGPNGSFYFAAHNGKLYCFEGSAPLMTDSPWPRFQANFLQDGLLNRTTTPTQPDISDYFSNIAERTEAGWVHVPWFGVGWLMPRDLPWVEHLELGYIFLDGPTDSSIWFYDIRLNDWLYANQFAKNFYFRAGTGTWTYHLQGTTAYTTRWFFDYGQMDWFSD